MSDDNNVSVKKQDIHDDNQQEKLVPELRFPEFKDEWKLIRLKNLINNESSKLSINNLEDNYGNYPLYGASGFIKNINFYKKEENYIAIVKDGSGVGNSFIYNGKSSVVGTMQYLNTINNNDLKFAYYLLQTLNLEKYKIGSSIPHIYFKDYSKEKIYLPSINEQKEISNFLSLIDEKIELLEKKSNLLKEYKHGFIQKLRTGKIKFKKNDGTYYSDWKEIKLSEILFEHKLKYTGNEEVYSVSVHKGVVNQIEHLGRSFATKDLSKYKLVKPGDLIYTKSPTAGFELGIIKQNKNNKNVVVSPLYGVFTPKSKYLGNYLDAYFESSVNTRNYLHPIVQKGAKNTMNITNKDFLSKSLYLPSVLEEQKKISDSINIINQKSEKIDNNILIIKQFKKGLLQKMFV
ncbi:MAG: restriction endonuclease subunit S [Methanobrevibacter sp.]